MQDLEYISNDALIEELSRRLDTFIIIGRKSLTLDNTAENILMRIKGDAFACLGLLDHTKMTLIAKINKQ